MYGCLDHIERRLNGVRLDGAEDGEAEYERADRGAERVDAMREARAVGPGAWISQRDDVRIGNYLLQRKAQPNDKQGRQHQHEGLLRGRRHHTGRAASFRRS